MESLLLGGFAMNRHGLRDGQFARIENLLPGRPGTAGRDSDRGQPAVCRSGDLEAPRWRAVARFARALRWLEQHAQALFAAAESGVWGSLFKALAVDPGNEYAMI